MSKKKSGGKVIASGGFGCVFRPALKCKGQTSREKNKITKLMLKKYATEEYEDVVKFETTLKKILKQATMFRLCAIFLFC